MERLGITPGTNTLSSLRNEDEVRLKNAAKKISRKYQIKRKVLRFGKKRKTQDPVNYKPGGFRPGVEPELPKKRKPATKQAKKQLPAEPCGSGDISMAPVIMFVSERDIGQVYVAKKR